MYKAVRNKPLGNHQLRFNKIVGQTRFKVERTFAGIARYVGKEKTHTQHLMDAMSYNLYRAPGIVMSNSNSLAK
jgi:IS5 family transposase